MHAVFHEAVQAVQMRAAAAVSAPAIYQTYAICRTINPSLDAGAALQSRGRWSWCADLPSRRCEERVVWCDKGHVCTVCVSERENITPGVVARRTGSVRSGAI